VTLEKSEKMRDNAHLNLGRQGDRKPAREYHNYHEDGGAKIGQKRTVFEISSGGQEQIAPKKRSKGKKKVVVAEKKRMAWLPKSYKNSISRTKLSEGKEKRGEERVITSKGNVKKIPRIHPGLQKKAQTNPKTRE